jgi:hypothetical protein
MRLARMAAAPDYVACLDRLKRANKHIGALKRSLRARVAGDAYEVKSEPDIQDLPEIYYDIFATERVPVGASTTLLVGDAVNSLRAALDNMAWALTLRHWPTPPPPDPIPWDAAGWKWRRVKFPIEVDPGRWNRVTQNCLWGVDPSLIADFERFQPYRRRKRSPERDEFRVLDELWSIDKHRRPNIFRTAVELFEVQPARLPAPDGYAFEIVKQRRPRPPKGRTHLGRVRYVRPPNDHTIVPSKVDMSFKVRFDVKFDRGAPAYGGRVVETLEACRDAVADALTWFEPEFR